MNHDPVVMCIGPDVKSRSLLRFSLTTVILTALTLLFSACSSPPLDPPTQVPPSIQRLNVGDAIKISFPGTPSMGESVQTIRRDGRINLTIIGEVKAEGKTPAELEKELAEAYAPQLISKEVKVTVVSSAFVVYVSGAVMKPGKIVSERSLTAYDAIMEAGGLDPNRANPKKVVIKRQEDGRIKTYPLNVKALLDGTITEPFYLLPYDTIHVPDKISWF